MRVTRWLFQLAYVKQMSKGSSGGRRTPPSWAPRQAAAAALGLLGSPKHPPALPASHPAALQPGAHLCLCRVIYFNGCVISQAVSPSIPEDHCPSGGSCIPQCRCGGLPRVRLCQCQQPCLRAVFISCLAALNHSRHAIRGSARLRNGRPRVCDGAGAGRQPRCQGSSTMLYCF